MRERSGQEFDDEIQAHGREALATLVIEGYRSGALNHHQEPGARVIAVEFDGFLKARNIYDHAYGIEEFERDLNT